MKIGVAAIVKNEGPYLMEWVAHYYSLGFDKIILSSNDSTDDTQDIIDFLVSIGVVDNFYTDPDRDDDRGYPQRRFYNNVISSYRDDVDIMAFFDADEFLFGDEPIKDIIELLFKDTDKSAVAINWVLYGSNGLKEYDDRLVTERFTRHSDNTIDENHYKTIARLRNIDIMINPHHPVTNKDDITHCDGTEIEYGRDFGMSVRSVIQPLRLHHYVTKSKQEWIRKIQRGSADDEVYKTEDMFDYWDHNEASLFNVSDHSARINKIVQEWEEKRAVLTK